VLTSLRCSGSGCQAAEGGVLTADVGVHDLDHDGYEDGPLDPPGEWRTTRRISSGAPNPSRSWGIRMGVGRGGSWERQAGVHAVFQTPEGSRLTGYRSRTLVLSGLWPRVGASPAVDRSQPLRQAIRSSLHPALATDFGPYPDHTPEPDSLG